VGKSFDGGAQATTRVTKHRGINGERSARGKSRTDLGHAVNASSLRTIAVVQRSSETKEEEMKVLRLRLCRGNTYADGGNAGERKHGSNLRRWSPGPVAIQSTRLITAFSKFSSCRKSEKRKARKKTGSGITFSLGRTSARPAGRTKGGNSPWDGKSKYPRHSSCRQTGS